MRIKLDQADIAFSKYIRLRDKSCKRCHSPVELNDKGLPVSHQASHYFGRGREGTRFDPDNVDTLCHGCHRFWETQDREAYREFKVKQLGEDGFTALRVRANTYKKKDRAMSLLISKQLLKEVL